MHLTNIAFVCASVSMLLSCKNPTDTRRDQEHIQSPPQPTQLEVGLELVGDQPRSPAGYVVKVDSRTLTVGANATVGVVVSPGSHVVELTTLPPAQYPFECVLDGLAKRIVNVTAGEHARLTFFIQCKSVLFVTGIEVTVTTTGPWTPSSVTVAVAEPGGAILLASHVRPGDIGFFRVNAGTYAVTATATGCGLFGGARRIVTVTENDHAMASMSLFCIP